MPSEGTFNPVLLDLPEQIVTLRRAMSTMSALAADWQESETRASGRKASPATTPLPAPLPLHLGLFGDLQGVVHIDP